MRFLKLFFPRPYDAYGSIVCALLHRDMYVLKYKIFDVLINSIIVLAVELIIWTKLYPQFGMSPELVLPLFVGWSLPLLMINLGYGFSSKYMLGAIYTGYGFMEHQLTLPLPTGWVVLYYILSFFVESLIVTLPLVGGALLFFHKMHYLFHGSFFLFFLLYGMTIFFCGTVFLALSFWYPAQWSEDNLWPRRLSPLITMGALFYPWYKVYAYSPFIAYVMLLNPLTYVSEGMRAALLGQQGYIPLSLCFIVVIGCISGALYWLLYSMRNRLDLL